MAAFLTALTYREIWAADFEFIAHSGERPEPVCLVAWELRSALSTKAANWANRIRTKPRETSQGSSAIDWRPPELGFRRG